MNRNVKLFIGGRSVGIGGRFRSTLTKSARAARRGIVATSASSATSSEEQWKKKLRTENWQICMVFIKKSKKFDKTRYF
jgi:hypothetical protein